MHRSGLHAFVRGKSFEIRIKRGLAPKVNVRDNLDIAELSYVMAAEAWPQSELKRKTVSVISNVSKQREKALPLLGWP